MPGLAGRKTRWRADRSARTTRGPGPRRTNPPFGETNASALHANIRPPELSDIVQPGAKATNSGLRQPSHPPRSEVCCARDRCLPTPGPSIMSRNSATVDREETIAMISRFRIAFPALLLLAAPAFAADDIKPEAILDKYVEVTGGRAAYEKIKTEVATGTLEITSIGLSGALTTYQAAPDKAYTAIEVAGGVGKAEEGSNGQVRSEERRVGEECRSRWSP